MMKWSELFPDGRVIFYEGDDPEGFKQDMWNKYQLDVMLLGKFTRSGGYAFHCPANVLDEIYRDGSYPLGS
jgi:hypothetical protein